MSLENLISYMMQMNIYSRLWHWRTSSAHHHTTYESFLTENEKLTDRLVESALGHDVQISFATVGVKKCTLSESYSLEDSVQEIRNYREEILKMKSNLDKSTSKASDEIATILDDAIELVSKTLYLLKLN